MVRKGTRQGTHNSTASHVDHDGSRDVEQHVHEDGRASTTQERQASPCMPGHTPMWARSEAHLSTFACRSDHAKREHEMPDEKDRTSMRSPYARDRDRILYSKAFRRLAHKTQVYLTSPDSPECNEHLRTRLTHTLEVVSLSKTMAIELGLNIDLVEAIAYGHDVGHAPFGHAGERELSAFLNGHLPLPRLIKDKTKQGRKSRATRAFGDFRHNFQGVRQLHFLLEYEKDMSGYNLIYQTLEGILKHTGLGSKTRIRDVCEYPQNATHPIFDLLKNNTDAVTTVEQRVVALADEIAQVCHDLNDAMELGALEVTKLKTLGPVERACTESGSIWKKRVSDSHVQLNSAVVERFIRHTCRGIADILEKAQPSTPVADVVRSLPVVPCPREEFTELRDFKDKLVINNCGMNRVDNKGRYIIRKLIDAYLSDLRQLPDSVIDGYMRVKKLDYVNGREDYCREWIAEITHNAPIDEKYQLVREDEISQIMKWMSDGARAELVRAGRSELLEKLSVYTAFDGDFARALADYIATMTDVFAEREMSELYF